jgi:hypothetical protein
MAIALFPLDILRYLGYGVLGWYLDDIHMVGLGHRCIPLRFISKTLKPLIVTSFRGVQIYFFLLTHNQ